VHDPNNPRSLTRHRRVILEDRSGEIWVGTRWRAKPPCARHWRVHPVPYDPRNPSSLSHDDVALAADSKGTSGRDTRRRAQPAGSGNRRLHTFLHEPGHPRSLSSNEWRAVLQDRRGDVWVALRWRTEPPGPTTGIFTTIVTTPGILRAQQRLRALHHRGQHGALWMARMAAASTGSTGSRHLLALCERSQQPCQSQQQPHLFRLRGPRRLLWSAPTAKA